MWVQKFNGFVYLNMGANICFSNVACTSAIKFRYFCDLFIFVL